jgi:hypothetical protein
MDNELTTILDRIANGQYTDSDKVQLAKFNVNIKEGKNIHIGDIIYPELNTEAIQAIANQIFQMQQTVNQLPATGNNSVKTSITSELASHNKLVNQSIPMNFSTNKNKLIYIYFSACKQDEKILEEIEKRLLDLETDGIVEILHRKKICPGANEFNERNEQLKKANIILLLVSTDFIVSSNHREEVNIIMSGFNLGKSKVKIIPILVEECHWEGQPYKDLTPLPRDRKPIGSSKVRKSNIYYDIASEIRSEINKLIKSK